MRTLNTLAIALILSGLPLAQAATVSSSSPSVAGSCGKSCEDTWARDHILLVESISRYSWAIDSLVDRDLLASVFAPNAVADYISVGKDNPMKLNEHLVGFEQIYAWLHNGILGQREKDPLVQTSHFLTDAIVDIDGSNAKLRFKLHARGGNFVAAYWVDAIKTPAGWRWVKFLQESRVSDAAPYLKDPLSRRFIDPKAVESKH